MPKLAYLKLGSVYSICWPLLARLYNVSQTHLAVVTILLFVGKSGKLCDSPGQFCLARPFGGRMSSVFPHLEFKANMFNPKKVNVNFNGHILYCCELDILRLRTNHMFIVLKRR